MAKFLLPKEIAELPNSPHKRDLIRQYKRSLRSNDLANDVKAQIIISRKGANSG